MRINKYLAESGIASRRGAEELIRDGSVKVNGKVVTDLATQIAAADRVEVNGRLISCQPQKVYILLNKPAGYVTTCKDPLGRKTVLDLLESIDARVFPVGRLDFATEGLLILTNDGEFAYKITYPGSSIPKTYAASVDKRITAEQLSKLRAGAGYNPPENVKVAGGAVEITICEGKNRQVRKMLEAVDLTVTYLKRISIGNLTLGTLKTGEWRHFLPQDFVCLFQK